MELWLHRDVLKKSTPTRQGVTHGRMYLNGFFECFMLEDEYRGDDPKAKIPGRTCIPCGRYRVRITWSPKFKRFLPLIEVGPNWVGVRIHSGNDVDDTEGCPLTGAVRGDDVVLESRKAFDALFPKLERTTDEIWLTVSLQPPPSAIPLGV